ncbi:MAG: right-handed parallel beta-helix repeat-containing protein [Halioglobus sp.]
MRVRNTLSAILGVVLLGTTLSAQAMVHRVYEGESIQAAIDAAAPGDTILVEPGTYQESADAGYGLRISTDNIRLIGKDRPHRKRGKGWGKGQGNGNAYGHGNGNGNGNSDGVVRILHNGDQETGIYAAPEGCEYKDSECDAQLHGFYLRGFTVEGFPVNGIQTRWVDGFKFVRNQSVNNLNNGIYPTLSANGLVRDNVSYGSLDTSMWVAGSENVRVVGNDLSGSPIGFEITVSNNVTVARNKIHNNTVGVGLFHPNAAGNPPLETMKDWIIRNNDISDNNLPNPAPPGTFQAGLPAGYGVLLLGVSDHKVVNNRLDGNDAAGIAVLDWCTAVGLADASRDCVARPPIADPSVNNVLVARNTLTDNGANPPPLGIPGVDLLFIHLTGDAMGNCYRRNKPEELTFLSLQPDAELPTDGC